MRKTLLSAVFVTCLVMIVFSAQNTASQELRIIVESVALLDVSNSSVSFEIPQEMIVPGSAIFLQNIEGGRLKYTSLTEAGSLRKITASLSDFSLLEVLEIGITVSAPDSGRGRVGVSSGRVLLTADPQPVVEGIGSGWTGTEDADGAMVVYDINIFSAEMLVDGVVNLEVLFTLTEG
jgi:hypothetical protein